MHQATPMNSNEHLAKAKTELADAWDTLMALKANYTPLGEEWQTLQKAQGLLLDRMQTLSNLQEARNRREYEAATRTSWGQGRAG